MFETNNSYLDKLKHHRMGTPQQETISNESETITDKENNEATRKKLTCYRNFGQSNAT
jgi:hypothetical protein